MQLPEPNDRLHGQVDRRRGADIRLLEVAAARDGVVDRAALRHGYDLQLEHDRPGAGSYQIGVWARQNGSTSRYDSYAILTFWVG